MASRVATGSRTGCISAKSDKCLKARTVSGESRNREILVIAIHSTKRQRGLIWFGAARAIIGIFLAAGLACCTATPATAAEDLYRAQTFMVNHAGTVYQKDLGERTAIIAKCIYLFDPDQTWKKVDVASP